MRYLRAILLAAGLAAPVGCGDGAGVSKPGKVLTAPDKSDKGLKGDNAPGPP